jgi:hypothetical protein
MFNALVLAMSSLVGIFILAWWRRPALRQWIEEPKYRFLEQERRFDAAAKDAAAPPATTELSSATKSKTP